MVKVWALKIIPHPGTEVALVGLVEYAEVEVVACQADLVFHAAEISTEKVEFESAAKITGAPIHLQQIDVQHDGDLESGQAMPVNVP